MAVDARHVKKRGGDMWICEEVLGQGEGTEFQINLD